MPAPDIRGRKVKWLVLLLAVLAAGCRHKPVQQRALDIRQLDSLVGLALRETAEGNERDSVSRPAYPAAVLLFYQKKQYAPRWSSRGKPAAQADSLLTFIADAADYGLYAAAYHYPGLKKMLDRAHTDTLAWRDVDLWRNIDLQLTDAFMKMANDLRYGILPRDSITLRKDSVLGDTAMAALLGGALGRQRIKAVFDSLQPYDPRYRRLQSAFAEYRRETADMKWDTDLPEQYTDTAAFREKLVRRLLQERMLDSADAGNSARITAALKAFQRLHDLYPDGVVGARTLAALNISKQQRYARAALNLNRWRQLPDSLPDEYIWINIPAYALQIWRDDTVRLSSRIVVGKSDHNTPLLSSSLINFQLYPYWRVPFSIIVREMLPAIKRDITYLEKHNLEIVDRHNNIVDPYKLNWKKYNDHYFPYLIRQMTGLDNSLGIIKFNFRNRYAVYLHDTNARGLFGKSYRALSHGCVRVQQWDSLAMYLVRGDTVHHMRDSVLTWMARQTQKLVVLRTRVPIYIRYITCEADNRDHLIFHEDVYGYDSTEIRKMKMYRRN
ncbi:L,D-transpeptidase family protein [Compostibacter hankyongensis]|uniref:L,D-transpeptidase family protein n=2 Tax=Compostibacter hankyongensis TaxID=1007089 RepID=A0ABP8FY23_9BACT